MSSYPRAAYWNACLFITDNSEMAANHMVGLYYDHMFKYWKSLRWPIPCTSQKLQRKACSVSRTTLIFGKFVEDSVAILLTKYQVCPLNRTCFSLQFWPLHGSGQGEDFQLSSKFIGKFQSSKSDDITRAATFAQGSANRVRSVTLAVPPARFHAFVWNELQAGFLHYW